MRGAKAQMYFLRPFPRLVPVSFVDTASLSIPINLALLVEILGVAESIRLENRWGGLSGQRDY